LKKSNEENNKLIELEDKKQKFRDLGQLSNDIKLSKDSLAKIKVSC